MRMRKTNIVGELVERIDHDCDRLARMASGEDIRVNVSPGFLRGRAEGHLNALRMLNKK